MKQEFVRGFDPYDKSFDLSADNFEEKLIEHIKKTSSLRDLVKLAEEYKFFDLEIYTDD